MRLRHQEFALIGGGTCRLGGEQPGCGAEGPPTLSGATLTIPSAFDPSPHHGKSTERVASDRLPYHSVAAWDPQVGCLRALLHELGVAARPRRPLPARRPPAAPAVDCTLTEIGHHSSLLRWSDDPEAGRGCSPSQTEPHQAKSVDGPLTAATAGSPRFERAGFGSGTPPRGGLLPYRPDPGGHRCAPAAFSCLSSLVAVFRTGGISSRAKADDLFPDTGSER